MPSRKDERWLNIVGHTATCNCPACVARRLHRTEIERFEGKIECPVCRYRSVDYVERRKEYVCFNPACGVTGQTLTGLGRKEGRIK